MNHGTKSSVSSSSSSDSTRELLLSLVDDMELVCREILENLISPKTKRMSSSDHQELVQLLMAKDDELQQALKLAEEQGEIEKTMEDVRAEVDRQDESIKHLQKQFKEAETLLSTSIFQAKQKLKAIEKAQSSPVLSEDLIKYGHRISASNAVCAPPSWQQGDPRRPYPTDMEMRLGFLARPEAATERPAHLSRSNSLQPPSSSSHLPDFHSFASPSKPGGSGGGPSSGGGAGGFAWQGGEVGLVKDGAHHPIDTGNNTAKEDVEVMSTDSSSSSSTDSN